MATNKKTATFTGIGEGQTSVTFSTSKEFCSPESLDFNIQVSKEKPKPYWTGSITANMGKPVLTIISNDGQNLTLSYSSITFVKMYCYVYFNLNGNAVTNVRINNSAVAFTNNYIQVYCKCTGPLTTCTTTIETDGGNLVLNIVRE